MASRIKFWPGPRPGPRPQTFGVARPGLDLVVLLCNWAFFSGKNRVNLVNFSTTILNRMLSIIIWYFFRNYFWPQP